jgi:hypothetical protein
MSRECLQCGNCCPDTCKYKSKNQGGLTICTIHPQITHDDQRDTEMIMCRILPERLYLSGIACKAIIQELNIDYDSINTIKLPNGQVLIDK